MDKLDPFCGRSNLPIPAGTRVLAVTAPLLVWTLLLRRAEGNEPLKEAFKKHFVGLMDAAQANPVRGIVTGTVAEMADSLCPSGLHRLNVAFSEDAPVLDLDQPEASAPQGSASEGEPDASNRRYGGLDLVLNMIGFNEEAFEKAHPWLRRVGLSEQDIFEQVSAFSDTAMEDRLREMGPEALESLTQVAPELEELLSIDAETADAETRERVREAVLAALRASLSAKPAERLFFVFPDEGGYRLYLQEIVRSCRREQEFRQEVERLGVEAWRETAA